MQLVREWQKEDEEKRSVTLTMIEVVNETEDGYGTQCSGVTIGKAGHFIDLLRACLTGEERPASQTSSLGYENIYCKASLRLHRPPFKGR